MNWDALGAIAELVSGFGVIATLIYLAVQIRRNTAAQLLEARSLEIEHFNNFRGLKAQSAELSEIWIKGCEGSELTSIETKRFEDLCLNQIFNVLGTYERSIVMGREATAMAIVLDLASQVSASPAMMKCWSEVREFIIRAGLQSYVDAVEEQFTGPKG